MLRRCALQLLWDQMSGEVAAMVENLQELASRTAVAQCKWRTDMSTLTCPPERCCLVARTVHGRPLESRRDPA